jgi:hypothetical protein
MLILIQSLEHLALLVSFSTPHYFYNFSSGLTCKPVFLGTASAAPAGAGWLGLTPKMGLCRLISQLRSQ